MSLSGAIGSLGTLTYACLRAGAGSHTDGIWTDGADTPFNIDANIQPVTGNELQALPEGRREQGVILILTEDEVRDKDRVTYLGKTYEVFEVQPWSAFGDTWYEALAAKQDVPA